MRRPLAFVALALLLSLARATQAQQDGGTPDAVARPADGGVDKAAASSPALTPAGTTLGGPVVLDPEELRRRILEDVRKELQKVRDETAWVQQDSDARAQDGEVLEKIKERVNFFQPHGYLRMRGEFFNNMDLSRGADRTGHKLFASPFIGTSQTLLGPGSETLTNHSQSDVNVRFRFAPILEISEDLSIHVTADILDNVLLGSDPFNEPYLDPFTPLAIFNNTRASSAVNIKRVWGRVNTQVGEFTFGRMPYHWGMGILHNDGNGLDQDFGDTYDRLAFTPRDWRGHRLSVMFDLLSKGASTTGEHGELGRSVDLDTLDDGYRLGAQVTHLDSPEELKRKLVAGDWVFNYGLVVDYRTQSWDTPVTQSVPDTSTTLGFASLRQAVTKRAAKLYQPDVFLSVKKKKVSLDLEIATTIGSVCTRAVNDANFVCDANLNAQPLTFFQWGGALQFAFAALPFDALILGVEGGFATGDKGVYGLGARPWRSGSGAPMNAPGTTPFNATGFGDIDGPHFDYSDLGHSHGRVNNFRFNRAYNIDMILWRNLISTVTSAYYLKPSLKYRPTGRKIAGGDDSGFELQVGIIYSQAFYAENTPSGTNTPLGVEFNVGITYDTADKFHTGLQYGALLPFAGLKNSGDQLVNPSVGTVHDASVAHALRFIAAIPF